VATLLMMDNLYLIINKLLIARKFMVKLGVEKTS
jgi:hypothetical protein